MTNRKTIVQERWQETGESVGRGVLYESTRLIWGLDSISLKYWYQVWYMREHWKFHFIDGNSVKRKPHK